MCLLAASSTTGPDHQAAEKDPSRTSNKCPSSWSIEEVMQFVRDADPQALGPHAELFRKHVRWFSWFLSFFFFWVKTCLHSFFRTRFICFILYSRYYKELIVFHRRLMARPWCFYEAIWSWSTWGWNWVLLSNFAITLRDSNRWNSVWNTEDPLVGNGGKHRSTQIESWHQRLQSRFMDIYYPWHGWSKV